MLTVETVTLELPLFVSVKLCELLLPTSTFPNAMLDELDPNSCVAATPVPESGIASGDPAALLTNEIDPETAPAPVGANAALNVVLPPAATVAGTVMPLMLKPVPVAVADVIVNAAFPVFFSTIVCEFGAPTITFPKLTLVGVGTIVG